MHFKRLLFLSFDRLGMTAAPGGETIKLLRVMKLTVILMIAACVQVSANGNAQGISLSAKNTSLQKVFKELQKQSGYDILYDVELIQKSGTVSIDVRNASLQQVLEICLKDKKLTYTIVDRTVVIKPKETTSPNADATNVDIPPTIDVSGKITDSDNNPLQGATVKVKGTTKGTVTNSNGVFTLKGLNEDAVLEISYIGYEAITVSVNNRTSIVLSLKRTESKLDEMQVIAYGTKSRRFQTGNVTTVKAEDIAKQPVNNPLLALEGRVAGLVVQQATGFAGTGVKVRIQGVNSISNGNDPLYVVDGVPYTSVLMPSSNATFGSSGTSVNDRGGGYGSPLNFINPSDIESIEILKDADATAIYGSQAANGAILITTKKAKAGEQKIEFNLQQGWGKVTRKMDLLNRRQYLDMRYEALKNDGINLGSVSATDANYYDLKVWDTTRSTDWQKELIGGTAHYTDLQASVSGGTANSYYLIGTGYHRETVVIPGDFADQKATVHFQAGGNSLNQKFQVRLTGNYLADMNKLPNTAAYDLTEYAIKMSPVSPPLYNADGTINWAPDQTGKTSFDNPAALLLKKYSGVTNNLISNLLLSYQLSQGLTVKSSFGYTTLRTDETVELPLSAIIPEGRASATNTAIYGDNKFRSWIIEPQLNYEKATESGKLDALIGSTIEQKSSSAQRLVGTGYISDAVLDDIRSASSVRSDLNFKFLYKYTAIFGRLNYNWLNKYIVNLTARRDGSSRFGEKNHFHNFGSVGGAWIFSEENFLQSSKSWLSFGKIKASYGTTGNDQIGDYKYLSTYSPVGAGNPYQGITTLSPNGLSNPYLQWEETKKINVGLELGFLKDKVLINANYFRNRSSNQLLGYALAATTGFSSITQNFSATVENTGVELSINTINIESKNIKWTSSANFTLPQNKLIAFPGIESSSYSSSLIVGEPITIQRKFRFLGVDPTTGVYSFSSKTNIFNPKTPDDATEIINTSRRFYGGFQNNVSYNGFELDFLFQFVKQKGSNYSFGFNPGYTSKNQPTYILDRWQQPGDHASYQKYTSGLSGSWLNAYQYSDAALADASFVRLKNISVSYRLAEKYLRNIHIHGIKIYAQGQNILTITKYKGLDPETLSSFTLPPLRVLTVGAQVAL